MIASHLAKFYRHIFLVSHPCILCARADDTVAFILLKNMRGPSGYTADGKNRRKQFMLDAELRIDRCGIEINVRLQSFWLVTVSSISTDMSYSVVSPFISPSSRDIFGDASRADRRFVYAVSKAHYFSRLSSFS